jgi:hypothetical protein
MVLIIRRVQVVLAQCDDDLVSMDDRPAEMALNDLAIGRIVVSLAIRSDRVGDQRLDVGADTLAREPMLFACRRNRACET